MAARIIILAYAVVYGTVFVECRIKRSDFGQVLKACNDSERPINNIHELTFSDGWGESTEFVISNRDAYQLRLDFTTPDVKIENISHRMELRCNSGEIVGTGKVLYVIEPTKRISDGPIVLDKNTEYVVKFTGEFDKTPTLGDECELKLYFIINEEEKSYCITDNITIITR